MVNFADIFVGTLFIQMWSVPLHLRVIYTIVVDFHIFEGSFYTFEDSNTFEGQ